jgi:cysteine desulfuration protein SufE
VKKRNYNSAFSKLNIIDIKDSFAFFDDWEDKYRFVIDLGKSVPPMRVEDQIEANLVRGCQSQVWLTHTLDDHRHLQLCLDSDAHIVRGLIAIVLAALNDKAPSDVLATDMDALFEELQLLQHLSPTRGNGLRAMIERVRAVAAATS